ncbi:uncharacterized protein CIMG_11396 [Coccidioides immitis RS]|uniref:Uncharacterized protein n=2 Tax=Coccidioides immitis TaxID=5501 RepID=A0A0D8JUL1_COCIM|nr:uncharacterized protein CIMG_11396 [Coccidioides immitis RS]KJF61040.1 hypothetical protein CIMG_11396 [Coccidioides immitis RS]KMP04949.1 hypothetical protein CIRG_04629 [Coccidioides immitis RMSCC 2394]
MPMTVVIHHSLSYVKRSLAHKILELLPATLGWNLLSCIHTKTTYSSSWDRLLCRPFLLCGVGGITTAFTPVRRTLKQMNKVWVKADVDFTRSKLSSRTGGLNRAYVAVGGVVREQMLIKPFSLRVLRRT